MTGQTQEQVVERLRGEAEQALKRELVLDAVADKLEHRGLRRGGRGVVRERPRRPGEDPDALLATAREGGGFEQLRGDLRLRKALDEVVAGVEADPGRPRPGAREAVDPEKEKAPAGMKIWTPGSEGGT